MKTASAKAATQGRRARRSWRSFNTERLTPLTCYGNAHVDSAQDAQQVERQRGQARRAAVRELPAR
eukprot:605302-Lingulodinium_polyedra.AAC.1